MEFLEAVNQKRLASFKSIKQHATMLDVRENHLELWLRGKKSMDKKTMRLLFNHFKLYEYGVEI